MKNIQTFEQYSQNQDENINEEFFGLGKRKSEKRKAVIQSALDKYVPVWVRSGKLTEPTEEELSKFWADAEADDYESGDIEKGPGGVGLGGNKKIRYRKSDDINVGYTRHSFGSGAP